MNRTSKRSASNRPFFTRFLEQQKLGSVVGGSVFETEKYPSDSDEDLGQGGPVGGDDSPPQTLKFPSDNDEDLPSP